MKKHSHFSKIACLASATLLSGCLGGGMGNNAGYPGGYPNQQGYPNQGYPNQGYPNAGYQGNPYGGYQNNGGQAGVGAMGALSGALITAIIQGMAGSVMNGQIGSQLAPVDQNFRLQQLGGMLGTGAINQSQQWLNPQTGSKLAITPIGKIALNAQRQQKCQNMEEIITLPDGQTIREKRVACLDPKTQRWNLVK